MSVMKPGEHMVAVDGLAESYAALRVCDGAAKRHLQQSLKLHGQLAAVVVAAAGEGQPPEVIDGFKRLRVARELGWKELRVQTLTVEPRHARLAVWTLNEGHGLSALEEAWVIRALYREDKLSQPEIGRLLNRHKSFVSRRLTLAECLDDVVGMDVRLGLLSPSSAEELVRLPRGNQVEAAEAVMGAGLTCVQTRRLVEALLACADPAARQRCLAAVATGGRPTAEPVEEKRREHSDAVRVVMDVALMTQAAARMQVRLHRLALAPPAEDGLLWRESLAEFQPVLLALSHAVQRAATGGRHATLEHP